MNSRIFIEVIVNGKSKFITLSRYQLDIANMVYYYDR